MFVFFRNINEHFIWLQRSTPSALAKRSFLSRFDRTTTPQPSRHRNSFPFSSCATTTTTDALENILSRTTKEHRRQPTKPNQDLIYDANETTTEDDHRHHFYSCNMNNLRQETQEIHPFRKSKIQTILQFVTSSCFSLLQVTD